MQPLCYQVPKLLIAFEKKDTFKAFIVSEHRDLHVLSGKKMSYVDLHLKVYAAVRLKK